MDLLVLDSCSGFCVCSAKLHDLLPLSPPNKSDGTGSAICSGSDEMLPIFVASLVPFLVLHYCIGVGLGWDIFVQAHVGLSGV